MSIRNIISFLAGFLLTISLFQGCKPEECLDGAGSNSSKIIETGYFKEANINGIFQLFLVQDSVYYIEFEGGKNLLEQTTANNNDSILWVDNNTKCYFLKDYQQVKVYLHFKKVNSVNLKEACTVRTVTPLTEKMLLTCQGQVADIDIELNSEGFFFYNHKTSGGKYIFRGWCTNCSIHGYYTGKVDASKLNTKNINIDNHSVIDYSVRAEESVHAKIFNSGNIVVYGNPTIYLDSIDGSGKVIPAAEN